MEKEFGSGPTIKSTRALQRGCPRRGILIGVGMVYLRSGCIIFSMQKKGCHMEENKGQEVISRRKLEEMK